MDSRPVEQTSVWDSLERDLVDLDRFIDTIEDSSRTIQDSLDSAVTRLEELIDALDEENAPQTSADISSTVEQLLEQLRGLPEKMNPVQAQQVEQMLLDSGLQDAGRDSEDSASDEHQAMLREISFHTRTALAHLNSLDSDEAALDNPQVVEEADDDASGDDQQAAEQNSAEDLLQDKSLDRFQADTDEAPLPEEIADQTQPDQTQPDDSQPDEAIAGQDDQPEVDPTDLTAAGDLDDEELSAEDEAEEDSREANSLTHLDIGLGVALVDDMFGMTDSQPASSDSEQFLDLEAADYLDESTGLEGSGNTAESEQDSPRPEVSDDQGQPVAEVGSSDDDSCGQDELRPVRRRGGRRSGVDSRRPLRLR